MDEPPDERAARRPPASLEEPHFIGAPFPGMGQYGPRVSGTLRGMGILCGALTLGVAGMVMSHNAVGAGVFAALLVLAISGTFRVARNRR